MAKFPRCTVCPRCGSGSFRRVRPEVVLPLRRVRECRRCQQQYRGPLPAPVCVLLIVIGACLCAWLGVRIQRYGWDKAVASPEPIALAVAGTFVFFVGAFKLIFQRGSRPPERKTAHVNTDEMAANAWREREAAEKRHTWAEAPPAATGAAPQVPRVPDALASLQSTDPASVARSKSTATTAAAPARAISAPTRTLSPVPAPVKTPTPAALTSNISRSAATYPMPGSDVLRELRRGVAITAHPLALNAHFEYDERHTRGLTRYYLASGVGGIAAAVHTTQFDIRKPKHNLLRRVMENIAQEVQQHEHRTGRRIVKVAGICGDTIRASAEAKLAADLGYDVGLLNLSDLPDGVSNFDLIAHCKDVARIIPIFGFYLNKAVGGRELPFAFWRALAEVPNVVAIKIAAFNRYHTLDVMRAVAESGRALTPGAAATATGATVGTGAASDNPIAIYTGNDDHIVGDLLGEWTFDVEGKPVTQRVVGGLLGHWAVWTRAAVETLDSIQRVNTGGPIPREAVLLDRQVTDMNGAVFDAANGFAGCLPGILEVLRRQGLVETANCLDPNLSLSPGQADEITRVCNAYPHLTDDAFITQHRGEWLSW